jgi:hypothetical protein
VKETSVIWWDCCVRVCLPVVPSNVAAGPEQDVRSVSCPINQCQHANEDNRRYMVAWLRLGERACPTRLCAARWLHGSIRPEAKCPICNIEPPKCPPNRCPPLPVFHSGCKVLPSQMYPIFTHIRNQIWPTTTFTMKTLNEETWTPNYKIQCSQINMRYFESNECYFHVGDKINASETISTCRKMNATLPYLGWIPEIIKKSFN